jgi:hypothetical protein
MTRTRRIVPALLVPALLLTMAAAKPYPSIIALPNDWAPEGIATVNHTFYSGSLVDGDIYRGDLRSGKGRVFIDVSGRQATGLKVDRRHGLLFVAGGFLGHAYVYDLDTGADVADYTLGTVINDVVVTRNAAYFTESSGPAIYKIPIAHDGALGAAATITVTGPAGAPVAPGGFGINGIDATPDGRTLIVCRSDFGALYTIDPVTGVSREITLTSGSLVVGTPDGILRVGRNLWVVENFANRLSRVRLSSDWSTGAVTATVTKPAFEVPTTVARHGRRLAVVNAKFDLGFPPPGGPGAPPGTPFEVVQFKAP